MEVSNGDDISATSYGFNGVLFTFVFFFFLSFHGDGLASSIGLVSNIGTRSGSQHSKLPGSP